MKKSGLSERNAVEEIESKTIALTKRSVFTKIAFYLFTLVLTAGTAAGASVLPAYAAPSSDKLEDGGVYIFLCSADQTYALDVAGASTSNGAAVQLYHSNGTAAQKFTAIENDDNTWTFKNYRSSLVLDAAGGGKADRTIIQQYQSNGTDAQKWKLQENDDGTVTFIAKASGKALDVAGGHMADHTHVWLWHANGTKAQKYYMHRVTGTVELENNGIYKITSALSTDKTISIADGSTGNGANVQLNTYHGDASQQFITKENSDGTWTFINYRSGLAFDAQYGQTKSGTNIWQYTPNGTDAQKWKLQDNGDGTGTFINARSGLAFDLLGGLANENQNVWLYNSNGTIAQKFNYEKVGTTPSSTADLEDGAVYTIKSAKDQNYGLDIAGASENDSANVQIYTLNGTPAQQFKAQKNDDGTWIFMNVNSGKVLDISGGNFNSGANVQQYASNGSAAQKWYAVANDDGSVTLRGSRSNVALDISGGQIKNDANVQIWSANDSDAQKFIFEKVRTITVDYDGNDIAASVVPESTSNTLYSKTTISTWIPVRDGFDFVGWNTQKDGQGTSYKPGEKAAFFDDITLYAQWVSFVSDYTITQYGTADGGQHMFYTIRSHSGKLIVVDGGYTSDASEVRDVIKENGGRVDAWILTHPHQDHIGAFNAIYNDPQGIVIDKIYAVDLNYDIYKNNVHPQDDFNTFQTFYDASKYMNNLTYVHEGDDFNVIGLKMHVYNAYDDSYPGTTNDYPNDGGMVFKLSGEKNSMLFLADVGKSRNDYLLEKYGIELKADYVQMGHHGNSTLSDELYQDIGAHIAFFDAPDWLISGGEYTTNHYIELMKSLGADVITYDTTPNTVKLE